MGCIGRGEGKEQDSASLKGHRRKPWPFPGPSEEGVEYATLDAAVGNGTLWVRQFKISHLGEDMEERERVCVPEETDKCGSR